jgi:hypothetical protein
MRSKINSNLMSVEQISVLNNNNSYSLDNSNIILNRLINEEAITQEEIVVFQEELNDRLGLIFKREEEWVILKQAQITARDLLKLEKHKIGLLLNHAKAIHYLQDHQGLNYSKEGILNLENEQKLLILLNHSKKMPVLKEAGYLGRDIFELKEGDLEDLLKQDAADIELLGYDLSPKFFSRKVDNSANYVALKNVLKANKRLITTLKRLGFEEEAIREMLPSRLSLLFEHIEKISDLQSLGYANEVIINELSEGRMRLLVSKSKQALEIAYDYPFTPSLIQEIGDEKLELILNHIDNARLLFESGFFKQIEFVEQGRLKLLLERSGEVGELIKRGSSVETIIDKPLKELNYLLNSKEESNALSKPNVGSSFKIIMDVVRGNILSNNWLSSVLSAPRLIGSYIESNKKLIKDKDSESKDSVVKKERGESFSVTNKKPLSSRVEREACKVAKGVEASLRSEVKEKGERFSHYSPRLYANAELENLQDEAGLFPSEPPLLRCRLLEKEYIFLPSPRVFASNELERRNMHA